MTNNHDKGDIILIYKSFFSKRSYLFYGICESENWNLCNKKQEMNRFIITVTNESFREKGWYSWNDKRICTKKQTLLTCLLNLQLFNLIIKGRPTNTQFLRNNRFVPLCFG